MKTELGSEVFTLSRNADGTPIYQVRLFNGKIVGATWDNPGAALAGAYVEERRVLSRSLNEGEPTDDET